MKVISHVLADHLFNHWQCQKLAVEPMGGLVIGTFLLMEHAGPLFFQELAVPSRKPAARSSKSIATQCGQMTTRLVWRPTSFHNMWPGLLNWRQGLREKIFPCTKSDLAAGGPWSGEWAASTPAKDCRARRKHSIFLHPGDSAAPPTASIHQGYRLGCDVSSFGSQTTSGKGMKTEASLLANSEAFILI